jgi:hypothetical protein
MSEDGFISLRGHADEFGALSSLEDVRSDLADGGELHGVKGKEKVRESKTRGKGIPAPDALQERGLCESGGDGVRFSPGFILVPMIAEFAVPVGTISLLEKMNLGPELDGSVETCGGVLVAVLAVGKGGTGEQLGEKEVGVSGTGTGGFGESLAVFSEDVKLGLEGVVVRQVPADSLKRLVGRGEIEAEASGMGIGEEGVSLPDGGLQAFSGRGQDF